MREQLKISNLIILLPYLKPYRLKMLFAIILMILGAICSIYLPMVTRKIIDVHIVARDFRGVLITALIAVGLLAAISLTNALRARLMALVGQNTIKRIRDDLFVKLQTLPVSFFDKIPVGKVITRLTSDVDAVSELVSNAIVSMVIDTLRLFGYLAVMFWLDWRLTIITLAFTPPLVFAMTYLNTKIRKAEDVVREETSILNAYLQESISGLKVIQAFKSERFFSDKFTNNNQDLLKASNRAVAIYGFFWPIVDICWLFSTAIMIYFGAKWVVEGQTTIGTLMAFFAYNGQFFGPLRGLSQAYRIIVRALTGAVRINEIMATAPETNNNLPAMPAINGKVEFKNVTFSYNKKDIVLKNINLVANPGETIALVGHTGAGKTSIINILCRFYEPLEGQVLVDGNNIFNMELLSYRRQVALVLQDPFLFSGSIRDNLAFGAPNASDEEMMEALETVGLKEQFARTGITLDSILTERGSNLSSGQRQLLSFARALLADPRILILDEATAYVDTLTEQKIQAALQTLLKGRTSFVIAHRLSTIRNADQILVIDRGKILEQGTHSELLELKGEYWKLCNA
ncbi:MAG: ABC transporter ATP-binding protein [Firmicutes bacterium]|nr:ABC transporter ATP-binding protein [Bacillota bacterium]